MEASKLEQAAENTFSHVKQDDTEFVSDGLRDFFLYRDLGIAKATGGKVIAQLVRANKPPEAGTGWHRHIADFHVVIMLKGRARFMSLRKIAPAAGPPDGTGAMAPVASRCVTQISARELGIMRMAVAQIGFEVLAI